jgi:catechol 2,3-dioxygenase-like lactoylglutathione lyase family enzyme
MRSFIPGINHLEFWVSSLEKSLIFYESLFPVIGWKRLSKTCFGTGHTQIYFREKPVKKSDSVGPRHIGFQATTKEVVDQVAQAARTNGLKVVRGPEIMLDNGEYSEGYYAIFLRDPDGYKIEVAYTPHMILG